MFYKFCTLKLIFSPKENEEYEKWLPQIHQPKGDHGKHRTQIVQSLLRHRKLGRSHQQMGGHLWNVFLQMRRKRPEEKTKDAKLKFTKCLNQKNATRQIGKGTIKAAGEKEK